MVTSGGMECIDAGLPQPARPRRRGGRRGADLPRRADGVQQLRGGRRGRSRWTSTACEVDALAGALDGGLRPKFLYVDPRVPEPDRPHAQARAPARARRAVPRPRRADLRGRRLPRAGLRRRRAAVAVVARPRRRGPGRHVLQDLRPGVRLGWAAGPADVIAAAGRRQAVHRPVRGRARAAARRGVRPRRELRAPDPGLARAVRVALAGADRALRAHLPEGCTWSEPAGGFFTWLDAARHDRHEGAARRPRPRPASPTSGPPVLPRRRRRQRAALLVQPPRRGRARHRGRAPRPA